MNTHLEGHLARSVLKGDNRYYVNLSHIIDFH